MPPSTNRLYRRVRGGGLALTEEAKRFREDVKKVVVSQLGPVSAFPTSKETVYGINIDAYFDKLENPGWFEFWPETVYVSRGKGKGQLKGRRGERKAETRYKVMDIDNRVKFLQDCVCKSIGIPNDCQVFQNKQTKYEDPENPRVEVTLITLDPQQFFPKRR